MKKLKKLMILAGVLLLLMIIGVVILVAKIDSLVKSGVEAVGPQVLKVDVKIEDVQISLLGGRAGLKGFVIGNPEGFKTPSCMSLDEVALEINYGSLLSDVISVPEIVIRKPKITLETKTFGIKGNNLSALLANIEETTGGSSEADSPPATPVAEEKPAAADETEKPGPPQYYSVKRILIAEATISVSDTLLKGQEHTLTLPDLEVPELSSKMTLAEIIDKSLRAILKAAASQPGPLGDRFKKITAMVSPENLRKARQDVRQITNDAAEKLKKTGEKTLHDLKKSLQDGGTPKNIKDILKGTGEDSGEAVKKARKDVEGLLKGFLNKPKPPEEDSK
jgi:AsmA family